MLFLLPPYNRRLVLGAAIVAALLVAALASPPPSQAQGTQREVVIIKKDAPADAKSDPASGTRPGITVEIDTAEPPEPPTTSDRSTRKRGGVTVGLGGKHDRDYDSFEDFVQQDPHLAALVFGVLLVLFLSPVLVVGLVIWYKLRKSRMINETLLQLAEKGHLTSSAGIAAIVAGRPDVAIETAAASAPLIEQVKALRGRVAWGDLRKGVILSALGIALTFFSMLDDGTPNGLGLVLLFLGLGYCVLWYFEQRNPKLPAPTPPPAGGA